jgi:hypothetical protein
MLDLSTPRLNLHGPAPIAMAGTRPEAGKLVTFERTNKRATRTLRRMAAIGKILDSWLATSPGKDIDIVSAGGADAADPIEHLVRTRGPFDSLTFSTFAAGEPSVNRIHQLKTAGLIGRIVGVVDALMLCSSRHAAAGPALRIACDELESGAIHLKAYILRGDRKVYTITGSANLSANPRLEVLSLSTDPRVGAFYGKVIEDQIARIRDRRAKKHSR